MAAHIQGTSWFDRRFKSDEHTDGPFAVELGAGIGLLSILLALLGWTVKATDIEPSLTAVLSPNIEANRQKIAASGSGNCDARHLDWLDADAALPFQTHCPIDLVLTTDTLYVPELAAPLFRTIRKLATPGHTRVFVALERRDPGMVDRTLADATKEHGMRFEPIARDTLRRDADRFGNPGWDWDELEDVQVYECFFELDSI